MASLLEKVAGVCEDVMMPTEKQWKITSLIYGKLDFHLLKTNYFPVSIIK
jgi:hypothetical protein